MKDKAKNLIKKYQNEEGVVIVESAIVFPVMFFVLFFIIFIGNLYYEMARVDALVMDYAIKGAQCCADPLLYDMYASDGTAIPTEVSELRLEPYRYILGSFTDGSISKVEERLSNDLKKDINAGSLIFFDDSGAKYVDTDNDNLCNFENMLLYSSFVVQVNYEAKIPISFMNMAEPTLLKLSSRAEVPVSDTDEFIRNVDMAIDLVEDTNAGKTIAGIFQKISSFINAFAEK